MSFNPYLDAMLRNRNIILDCQIDAALIKNSYRISQRDIKIYKVFQNINKKCKNLLWNDKKLCFFNWAVYRLGFMVGLIIPQTIAKIFLKHYPKMTNVDEEIEKNANKKRKADVKEALKKIKD